MQTASGHDNRLVRQPGQAHWTAAIPCLCLVFGRFSGSRHRGTGFPAIREPCHAAFVFDINHHRLRSCSILSAEDFFSFFVEQRDRESFQPLFEAFTIPDVDLFDFHGGFQIDFPPWIRRACVGV
jgi:hypothetical protein